MGRRIFWIQINRALHSRLGLLKFASIGKGLAKNEIRHRAFRADRYGGHHVPNCLTRPPRLERAPKMMVQIIVAWILAMSSAHERYRFIDCLVFGESFSEQLEG